MASGVPKFDVELGGNTPVFPDEFDELAYEGHYIYSDYFLFHKATGTLITTDTVADIAKQTWYTTVYGVLGGGLPRRVPLEMITGTSVPPPFIKDKIRQTIEKLLEFPIQRLVCGHGGLVSPTGSDLKAAIRAAFTPWVFDS